MSHNLLVSTVRVERRGSHAIIRIWNRGGLAGQLVVAVEDAHAFVTRLKGTKTIVEGLAEIEGSLTLEEMRRSTRRSLFE